MPDPDEKWNDGAPHAHRIRPPAAAPTSMTELTTKQEELCAQTDWDFSDLRALFINCTLKRSPEQSHTQGLADISMEIMRRQGVTRRRGPCASTTTSPPACGPT